MSYIRDSNRTVYTVGFKNGMFLMVWNPKRNGWEMPGGHIREGESLSDAATREYFEESGYTVDILALRDLGTCHVAAANIGKKPTGTVCEMDSRLFDKIPDELFFDRDEYVDVIAWAHNILTSFGKSTY